MLFRWGQAAMNAHPRGALRDAWQTKPWLEPEFAPDKDITPGVMIAQKEAGTDHTWLWVGAILHKQETEDVRAEITLRDDDLVVLSRMRITLQWFGIDSERVITNWAPGTRFFHTHLKLEELSPNTWYRASVRLLTANEPPAPMQQPSAVSARYRSASRTSR
jgi:hypothetical protein